MTAKPIPPTRERNSFTWDGPPILSGDDSETEASPAHDGWHYVGTPGDGDARKFVTLEQDGMIWVGIRAWHHQGRYWVNNGEPERAKVIAWRDLHEPARGFWEHGKLYVPATPPSSASIQETEKT